MTEAMIVAIIIARLLAVISTVVIAGVMALHERGGWGWFLFVALLLSSFSLSINRTDVDE